MAFGGGSFVTQNKTSRRILPTIRVKMQLQVNLTAHPATNQLVTFQTRHRRLPGGGPLPFVLAAGAAGVRPAKFGPDKPGTFRQKVD